jgi:CBS domain containing-hemolysin-like protein
MSLLPVYLAAVVVLLGLEALVSMTEAAFFAVPGLALKRFRHELEGRSDPGAKVRLGRARQVEQALSRPNELLGAVLVFDMLVSVSLSSVVALLSMALARHYEWPEAVVLAAGSAVLLLVLLVVGEVLPKVLAVRQPLRYALALAGFGRLLQTGLAPVAERMERATAALLGRVRPEPFPTRSEFATMMELGRERGVIRPEEEAVLASLAEMDERSVSAIMTPRIAMAAVERNQPVRTATELACRVRRSRIPVYDGTIDHVTGVYYAKDSFAVSDDAVPVGSIAREAFFVPEVKPVSAVLEEFRRQAVHIAIVIDEFGQTAGLVTLEDVLESIFGEIRDEYDPSQPPPFVRVDAGAYRVDGDIDIETLNRLFGNAFRGEDFERLAAFIHYHLGHLPAAGEKLLFRDLVLEIREMSGNAIRQVLIRREGRAEERR